MTSSLSISLLTDVILVVVVVGGSGGVPLVGSVLAVGTAKNDLDADYAVELALRAVACMVGDKVGPDAD